MDEDPLDALDYETPLRLQSKNPFRVWVIAIFAPSSFLIGMISYIVFIGLVHRQWVSGGDLGAIFCFCFAAFAVVAVPIWTVLLLVLRQAELDRLQWCVLVPPIAAIIPAGAILLLYGGGLNVFVSAEFWCLIVMFSGAGSVYGFGWFLASKPAVVGER